MVDKLIAIPYTTILFSSQEYLHESDSRKYEIPTDAVV